MTDSHSPLPRVEDHRSDLTADEVRAAAVANARSIAMQSYLHGFSAFLNMRQLTEFVQGRSYMAPDEDPLAGWFLMRKLSDTTTTTVSPNVDTLYGAAYAFLGDQGPMVLTVPAIPGRYFSVAILDAYFNNFATISPRTYDNAGGDFLLAPPGWAGRPPAGIRDVIVAPTPIICLFQRIFVFNTGEYEAIRQLQDAIQIIPLSVWAGTGEPVPAADLSPYRIQGMRETRDPLQYFETINFFRGINPPPAEDAGLMALFDSVGVGPGSSLPEDPALREGIALGAADAQAAMNARLTEGPYRDGWTVPDPLAGRSGPHILSRATVQLTQLGAFTPEEAIYFFALRDADMQRLNGRHAYTLHFDKDQIPPLNAYGFWSLTMYNESYLLVDNPLNRYALRPDAPGLTYEADGGLTLYLAAEQPAGVPQANWLPAPGGEFSVALRTYLPKQSILDRTWFPPALRRVM